MDSDREALRLKTLAEQNYTSSNLKSALKYATRAHRLSPSVDGLSETLTALQILSAAAASPPDWYKILQIDPFSHINIVKKQYKKLALTLHPDKNPFAACEEAFKLVAEGFRVLSDKTRRKEYDVRLRMAMQEAATEGGGTDAPPPVDGFWMECLVCRVVHRFDRKYLGHNLMCPSCKKSFSAVAVNEREEDVVGTRASARIRTRGGGSRSMMTNCELGNEGGVLRPRRVVVTGVSEVALEKSKSKRVREGEEGITLAEMQKIAKRGVVTGVSDEALEKSKSMRAKIGEEGITLSEMQTLAKKKVREEKMRLRVKEKVKEGEKAKEGRKCCASNRGKFEDKKRRKASDNGELEIMEVEDSDFYDFDKDRVEKSFKKGQVWAVYDDDDGMPRHYSLIDEVSVYPFKVKLSWLELQIGSDERLLSWEKMGVRISCGRFKVAQTDVVDSVNIFSHFVNAERAAREIYRVYPRKGSVWALFNEDASQNKDKRCYNMVVCLTNYDEVYGLSMAYLEKVEGFKSVFKRREIGCHAVKSLAKDDFRLFSHQIPARKLTGEEAPDLSTDCWELDPASLPPELLKIRWHK